MSLTGKNISELTSITGYSANSFIPIYKNNQTYKGTFTDLQPTKKWVALLTQTGPITLTSSTQSDGGLILNEVYIINSYVSGDDFSNIAQVLAGTINTTNCVFKVTGNTNTENFYPTTWNGSQLISQGEMVVTVLENSLGTDVVVEHPAFNDPQLAGVSRLYPVTGQFFATNTTIKVQQPIPYGLVNQIPVMIAGVDRETSTAAMWVFDFFTGNISGDLLNNCLVEINVYK